MASLQENVQTIKDSVARMKVAAELPVTATLEELTSKVEEGVGSSGSSIPKLLNFKIKPSYTVGIISSVDVTIPTVTNITNSIYEEV